MKAAYLNQAINLLVSVLMVPMLLKFLSLGDYILWAIFTTFGGITLQIEGSVQILAVREIATEFHAGSPVRVDAAIRRARKAYRALSLFVLIPFTAIGMVYFTYGVSLDLERHWQLEWFVFALTYSVNYFFGANNSILLAMGKVREFNYIGSFSRTLYFGGTLVLLLMGLSVVGICISFAVSVATTCSLVAIQARRSLRAGVATPAGSSGSGDLPVQTRVTHLAAYTAYTFAAYALYRGGVLVAAHFYPKNVVGAYGLTLQTYAMLTAFALVPIQVWLSRLVKAILKEDAGGVIGELSRTLMLANGMFLGGVAGMVLLGNRVLATIGSSIALPAPGDLLIAAFAFLIELNMFVLLNFLVTKRQYQFVPVYLLSAGIAFSAAIAAVSFSRNLFLSLVLLPAIVQLTVCLPLVVRLVSAELKMAPGMFVSRLWQHAVARH
jgi:hypothetical protein